MLPTVTSAYIHIPFCKSKCKYCSFVSTTDLEYKTGNVYSLLKEIDYYYKQDFLNTLYIGGGTPSVLEITDLSKIINKFKFNDLAEKTIELNPNDITVEYMGGIKELGFNRISIGAQSFNDSILNIIGRRHSSEEIYKSVEIIKQAGFDNISVDLIYGLPNQTVKDFEHDLNEVISLDIPHISLYGLKIDENCYFYKNMPENIPDEDTQADMYILAGEITKKSDFNHYEISNYSKSGYESKHNTNYWKCGGYYGFGVAAHGYTEGIRYSNTENLKNYLENPISREFGKFLTEDERLEEKIFLGLRLFDGINTEEINSEFNIDFDRKYKSVIQKYTSSGHIIQTDKGYRLSNSKDNNGFLISNVILSEFLSDK